MKVHLKRIDSSFKLSAEIQEGISVSAELVDMSPAVRAEIRAGLRVATTLLCCCLVIGAVVQPQMDVQVEMVTPISKSKILSNFITLDDMYVMTADGKIFYVQED